MAGNGSILSLGGALMDGDSIHDAKSVRSARAAGVAHEARTAQMADELLFERSASLNEESAVDRLVRHAHGRIIGECSLEANRYLPGRPIALQLASNPALQPGLTAQSARLRPPSPVPGLGVCSCGSIFVPAAVSPNFSADRRGRPSELASNLPARPAGSNTARYLLALLSPERRSRSATRTWPKPTCLTQYLEHRRGAPAQTRSDLAQREPSLPALPKLRLLRRGEPPPSRHPTPPHPIQSEVLRRRVDLAR